MGDRGHGRAGWPAVDNIASRRVLERSGFQLEGIARDYLIIAGRRVDHARYGLLRTEVDPASFSPLVTQQIRAPS